MPVIKLSLSKLESLAQGKHDKAKILETLPYLGLDIEGIEGDSVSVEYSPNRADFSSEAGIARSLLGLLDIKTGLPDYDFSKSKYEIQVAEDKIKQVRPYIFGIYCELDVTEEVIKQLITMQEDLHNGLGRRRFSVAIGIHNAETITRKIMYHATLDAGYSFVPLGSSKPLTISEILSQTEQGVKYGKLVSSGIYPLLEDSEGHILSFPPIINGERTRLKPGLSKLFIDVTATDKRAGDAVTAIIASMLSDIGAKVETVSISSGIGKTVWTPDMTPQEMKFDLPLSNNLLGSDLTEEEARKYLGRCRLALTSNGVARIPRYRSDVIHPVDLVEEIALGYGIARIEPLETVTSLTGSLYPKLKKIDDVIEILIGLGLTEIWNLSLVGVDQVSRFNQTLKVDDPKSQSFEYLRCDLASSLLSVLGACTSLEYPQRIFEVAPVFIKDDKALTGVLEQIHAAVFLAGSGVNYTEARSFLDALFRILPVENSKISLETLGVEKGTHLLEGRAAAIIMKNEKDELVRLGTIGEVSPSALTEKGIFVPVSGFEINLELILKD
ncbi:MAG: phenylalanine--tRNA ligase subunit beta [Nitrososphaerales archaeon]